MRKISRVVAIMGAPALLGALAAFQVAPRPVRVSPAPVHCSSAFAQKIAEFRGYEVMYGNTRAVVDDASCDLVTLHLLTENMGPTGKPTPGFITVLLPVSSVVLLRERLSTFSGYPKSSPEPAQSGKFMLLELWPAATASP